MTILEPPPVPAPEHFDHYDDYVEACDTADTRPIHENEWYAAWVDDQHLAAYERNLPDEVSL